MEPAVPVRTVPPVYPTEMRRNNINGVVTVACRINPKGEVEDVTVVKASDEAFRQAALDAVRKWKFKPARRDGVEVPIRVSIPIFFKIES